MSESRDSEAGTWAPSEDERGTLLSSSGPPAPAGAASADLTAAPAMTSATTSTTSADYRDDLGSRRWDAAPLRNPEVEKTDPRIAVAAILILATITLVVVVLGYASGFWQLGGDETAARDLVSAAVAALELLA